MLSESCTKLLISLIENLGQGELKSESYRQSLAYIDSINYKDVGGPYVAFQRIDRDRDDFIKPEEII